MRHYAFFTTIILLALASPLLAADPAPLPHPPAAPLRVIRTIETREPAAHPLALLHGETIELQIRLLNYATPLDLTGYAITLHGQTNGQLAAESYQLPGAPGLASNPAAAQDGWAHCLLPVSTWWPASAQHGRWTLLAAAPSSDDTPARILRAGGPLEVRGTAATSTAAPLPSSALDSLQAWTLTQLHSLSNTLFQALQEVDPTEHDPLAMPALQDHTADDAVHLDYYKNLFLSRALQSDWPQEGAVWRAQRIGNHAAWISVRNGTGMLTRATLRFDGDLDSVNVSAVSGFTTHIRKGIYNKAIKTLDQRGIAYISPHDKFGRRSRIIITNEHYMVYGTQSIMTPDDVKTMLYRQLNDGPYGIYTNALSSVLVETNFIVDVSDHVLVTYDDLQAARDFAITQAVTQANTYTDVATNTIIQTWFLGTNGYLSVSNDQLQVWVDLPASGPTNIWTGGGGSGGNGGSAIDPSFTNAVWQALGLKADAAAMHDALATKAPRAWGDLAPDGTANPDPLYMLFLNKPTTMHAAGYVWQTYGTISVLSSSGTTAFETGADGTLRIGPDDGTNHFGYIQGGQIVIGALINSFVPNKAAGTASMDFTYNGGEFPVLWIKPELEFPTWASIAEVTLWVDNGNGTATATIPLMEGRMFVRATTTYSAANYFYSTMPAKFFGGVVGDTNQLPVIYNSTPTITIDGQSYRLPAERITP